MNTDVIKERLNLNLDETSAEKLEKFMQLFKEYNSHTNLMSKNDVSKLFEKHVFDALSLNLFFQKYSISKAKMLDIGTGGGFPSLPIAICFENINVVALDSIKKKIDFISLTKENLDLKNIEPKCSRVEDLPQRERESFDIVTTRAVADLNVILEYAIPFLKVGGYFVAYKSKIIDKEINDAQNALKILGAKIVEKIEYKLPMDEDFERFLLVIKKEKPTSINYPRPNGMVKKNPL